MLRARGECARARGVPTLAALLVLAATIATNPANAQPVPAATPSATPAPNASPAPAPEPPNAPSGRQRAEVHYERSRAYYAVGRYRAAINELETAIRLDPEGRNLFFDLGLVYERVGDVERAQAAYRNYLASIRDRGERERVERMLNRLRGARLELADMNRPGRGRADALFWGATAGALVATAVGVTVLVVATRSEATAEELRRVGSQDAARAAGETATVQFVAGAGLVSVGVGLGVAAAALFLAREALPRTVPLCVSAGPTGVSAALRF